MIYLISMCDLLCCIFDEDLMRSKFAILFLTVYALVLFQPIVPWIDYYLHKDYIAKNLCENRMKPGSRCNGKCYLAKELKKSTQGQPTNPSSQKNSASEETVVHLNNSFSHDFQIVREENIYVQYAHHCTISPREDGIERPPCA